MSIIALLTRREAATITLEEFVTTIPGLQNRCVILISEPHVKSWGDAFGGFGVDGVVVAFFVSWVFIT